MTGLEPKVRKFQVWGWVFAILCLFSFFMAVINPSNGLWVIPLLTTFIGIKEAQAKRWCLQNRINKAYGHNEEEYY